MSVAYESMTTSELIGFVGADPSASRREREMLNRLNHLLALVEAHVPAEANVEAGVSYPRNLWRK